jgi:putative glycosyltransferase (exosortase G-associated)
MLMEIIPSIGSIFLLIKRRKKDKQGYPKPEVFPEISIIVPVYRSEATLGECLESVYNSTYPLDRIRVFLVNNEVGGEGTSFSVFTEVQERFPDMNMQWLNASQGKSRALNLALYNSKGKYIINMDSDGFLEPHALENLITKFEANPDLNCMTGAILIVPEKIKQYKHFFPRLMRNLEFMEYAQAFLAGRSYASEMNRVYTLSGAFSAFRKSAVLQSRLYNTDTICEDTQLTFQMRYLYDERVEVCENAIFFTEPIEDVNKLYTQRQRWQRGSLEVAQMFADKSFRPHNIFRDINVKTLIYDHTFAFPRLIWYLALIYIMCKKYAGKAVLFSTGLIFLAYILVGYFYFFSVLKFLKMTPEVRAYYKKHWWVVALLPLFNLCIFFVRMAGIINSIGTDSAWKTENLTQEREEFEEVIKSDAAKPVSFFGKIARALRRSEKQPEQKSAVLPIAWYVICGIVLVFSLALLFTVRWVSHTYGIGLNELLSTLGGNLTGTATDVILAVVRGCVLPAVAALALYIAFVVFDRRRSRKKAAKGALKRAGTAISRALPGICSVVLIVAVLFTNLKFDVFAYYQLAHSSSGIYEEYYISPNDVTITSDGQTKNLIYIYLESMETTYASAEDGGVQSENYISELTALAQENTSFSDTDKLGGFHTVTGAGFTMAALFTTTTGVPYALPVDSTTLAESSSFASGLTGLGDILAEEGYNQEFLCGSDATFGGRRLYFTQHGNYDIFDLYTAREQGYIPEDYFVWWGFEDYRMFDIAKDEALRLADEDEPFNLTMLTVDLHHIAGYVCPECGSDYSVGTANVASCTSRLVNEFVEWCKQQDFYDDTVIVITGDHPRMDTYLVDGVSYYDRTVYNCIINPAVTTENTENREFTHMDIFPTVLAAMGYDIEGNRLGLGTNLFSERTTLAEELGFDYINSEVSKSSDYYLTTFAPELSGEG